MSNTGGDGGDGDRPPSPETTTDDPLATLLSPEDANLDQPADGDDAQPPQPPAGAEQNPDGGATQDTSATEQPQQGDVQGTEPVLPEVSGPSGAQSQDSASVQAPSPAETVPATPSKGGFMSGLTRWIGGRRASSATASGAGNTPRRSTQSIASGSRRNSLVEEPEAQTSGPHAPELAGPSGYGLDSPGSGPQGRAGSSSSRGTSAPRATRADTGLSVDTEVADLEARGENTPTPIRIRNRPNPLGPRSARATRGGGSPDTPEDEEAGRRNQALISIFEQMRYYQLINNVELYNEHLESVKKWEFQLGVNTLKTIATEGVVRVKAVLDAAGEKVPPDIQTQIIEETQNTTKEARKRVSNGLLDECIFIENTARHINDILRNSSSPTQRRRRGTSSGSNRSSLDPQASEPERGPLDPEALKKLPREQLVRTLLEIEQRRKEAYDAVATAEDYVREREQNLKAEMKQIQANTNKALRDSKLEMDELRKEVIFFKELAGETPGTAPPRPVSVDQPPTEEAPEGSPEAVSPRSRAGSSPRSPEREQTFEALESLMFNLRHHEELVSQLQARAGLDSASLEARTAPFSENAQLPRTELMLLLQDVRETRDELEKERNDLSEQVERLEAARISPPGRPGTGLLGSLFGASNRGSSNADTRSRSASRAGSARSPQNLAVLLGEQGSEGSSDPGTRQTPESRRQSEAGSRHSGSPGNGSAGSRRQSEAGSRQSDGSSSNATGFATPSEGSGGQSGGSSRRSGGSSRRSNASGGQPDAVNPAPLRAIPEWLATHPNGPCRHCEPVFRFPPELGELPTCGCICDLALGHPPRSAGGSSRGGSSRSRASSGRSVRFADDGAASDGDVGRGRPSPLDLAGLGIILEGGDADRPDTPYPANTEGGQPDAPADAPADTTDNAPDNAPADTPTDAPADAPAQDEQAETPAQGNLPDAPTPGSQPEAPAPGAQAETVPIQPPVEEPAVVEQVLVIPATAATGGRRGGRCPCCGRGTYGVPPAGGIPQVAFYTCRNMAGRPAAAPASLTEVFRNIWAAAGAAAGFNGPREGGDADAPPVPGAEAGPRDRVMTYLTMLWDVVVVTSLLWVRYFWNGLLSLFSWLAQWGIYLNLRYVVGQNPLPPFLARIPIMKIGWVAMVVFFLWFVTLMIAIFEERRIWKAANAQLSAPYFRGTALRRPYPFWPVFEADSGLIRPAFGTYSQWLHEWYFA